MSPPHHLIPGVVKRIGLCLLAVAVSLAAPAVTAGYRKVRENAEDENRDRIELEESLEILATGDAASRRKVAENACSSFEALESFPYGEDKLHQIVEALRRYLRHEEDDWIAS